ncbi:MAG: hypothetical protein NE330_23990, partial [Lentisphaeraceae bacterium]|nr:hypothetical protein [Lentisphaeraceae bacterium]
YEKPFWQFRKMTETDNPFSKKFHNHYIPDKYAYSYHSINKGANYAAIYVLALEHKVDTIYWFCDMKDEVDDTGLKFLEALYKKLNVRIYIHSVDRLPPTKLRTLIRKNGGKIIRKKIR